MITTILTIIYLAIAYFLDSCTMKAIKQNGIPDGAVSGYETSLRVGVLIGSLLWPLTMILALINIGDKK